MIQPKSSPSFFHSSKSVTPSLHHLALAPLRLCLSRQHPFAFDLRHFPASLNVLLVNRIGVVVFTGV